MTTNQIINDTHVKHVRRLKAEVARLNEELALARAELESLHSHFALALEAALDARDIPQGGRLVIIDGWNAALGYGGVLREADFASGAGAMEEAICDRARAWLAANPLDSAWVVFDGRRASGRSEPRLRVSFTGGRGKHRADRMICDYLRMMRFSGASHRALVVTNDKAFRHEAASLGAETAGIDALSGRNPPETPEAP